MLLLFLSFVPFIFFIQYKYKELIHRTKNKTNKVTKEKLQSQKNVTNSDQYSSSFSVNGFFFLYVKQMKSHQSHEMKTKDIDVVSCAAFILTYILIYLLKLEIETRATERTARIDKLCYQNN